MALGVSGIRGEPRWPVKYDQPLRCTRRPFCYCGRERMWRRAHTRNVVKTMQAFRGAKRPGDWGQVIPKMPEDKENRGGYDGVRTCDTYHVKVVQDTNSRVKSKRKDR